MDYLAHLPSHCDIETIQRIHQERQRWVNQDKKGFLRYRLPALGLSKFTTKSFSCDSGIVQIGSTDEVSQVTRQEITRHLKAFMPWRKGPFSIFGMDVDAEWRSERKWQRILPQLPDLQGKNIADIGCNNGYYMFRMIPHKPQFILGLEPSVQHYYCFKGLNSMTGFSHAHIDLLGVEHINLFANTFDVIFLMGIIYHRPSPVEVLKDILTALKPGGTLILESQAIPGDAPVALFPESTYAKVPGTYFVPTGTCIANWMKRTGYSDVKLFESHPMSSKEQRRTDWMTFESYDDFINRDDPSLTVEGYPAPHRVYLRGIKK